MNTFIERAKVALGVALAGMLAGAPAPAQADDLNISQSPLFVATNVEPNVMFTFDDSGSMQWEQIPDSPLFGAPSFMFPPPGGVYGGFDEPQWVPIPWGHPSYPNNFYDYYSRSASNNPIYYDPETDYLPWTRADGTLMAQATATAALYNPVASGRGTINLLNQQDDPAGWFAGADSSIFACFRNSSGQCLIVDLEYWPITFFVKKPTGSELQAASYHRYQIRRYPNWWSSNIGAFRLDLATDNEVQISQFSWPNGTQRSVDEEIQNFANWFQYHRSRALAARAGIGQAFAQLPDQARVGFAAINKGSSTIDNVSTPTIVRGVRPFDDAGRAVFYDDLYGRTIQGTTPLRRAAEAVGKYFERSDSRGPWSTTPGSSGGEDLACRQSFHILMSDGFWNGNDPNVGNADGSAGATITGPDQGSGPQSYKYSPVAPFSDTRSNTLADVAMHYWKRDLRTDIPNRVSVTPENPAFWQHLTSFGIGLGVEGTVDPDAAFAAIESGATIDWGDPFTTNAGKTDDLLHFGLNGRGGFFSAGDPETFAEELGALLLEIVSRTAATTGLSVSTTRLTQDSVAFAAEFDSQDWSGEVRAVNVLTGATEWEAAARLDARSWSGRKLLTSRASGTGGQNFDRNMEASLVRQVHGNNYPTRAYRIIDYVRGDRSREQQNGGPWRDRSTVLADIVNSRPVFAGPGNEGWSRLSGAAGSTYAAFVDAKQDATQAVYIGANGGMLHAFDAETGDELFGYVPRAVLGNLRQLVRTDYGHRFFADGQQVVRDAYNNGWRRVLVGTLGAGGRGVYALDVTDPTSPSVLWEMTGDDEPNLGYTFGDPIITRLGNGAWVAIFGNGYNSADNNAVLFVVDLFSGNVRNEIVLESTSDANGLSGVAPLLDPVSRAFTRRIYAGDLRGTMWRVDFDNSGLASVKHASGLFSDPDRRPITSSPALAASPAGGVFVYFGTGKLIEPQDRLVSSLRMEKLYAVRDSESRINNMNGFGTPNIVESGGERTIVGEGGKDGWVLSLAPSSTPTGERVLARPAVVFGRVVFTTFQPVDDPCAPGGEQRLYVIDALTGGGALGNICENCGVVEIGIGAPVVPPIIISDPAVNAPGGSDPSNPFLPPDSGSLPDSGTVGAVTGWCRVLTTLNPATGQPLPIGPICDGRQSWRQVR